MSTPIPATTLRHLQRLPQWTNAVVNLLHGPGIGSVWVQVGRYSITPHVIRRVGDSIRNETVKVYYDPSFIMVNDSFSAFYDGGYDAIFGGVGQPTRLLDTLRDKIRAHPSYSTTAGMLAGY